MNIPAWDRPFDHTLLGLLLALAYPDRIARRREGEEGRYLLANGRGARLRGRMSAPWLVAASLDGAGGEAAIWLAAEVTPAMLESQLAQQIECGADLKWDKQSEAVVASESCRLGALVLRQRPLRRPDPEAMRGAMLDGVKQLGLAALPWSDEALQLQARVLSLRQWLGEQGWPDLGEQWLLDNLNTWLAPYLAGCSRREHLGRLDLCAILRAQLDWPQQQALDRLAPTHMPVPSGSRKRLHYSIDAAAPVLAVKLQELFGLNDTPRIADGRVPLTLHLLSPAQRPIQVTQDLASFWRNTYAEVKKELKGRYPKHPWPDDPMQALPQAGVRRKHSTKNG